MTQTLNHDGRCRAMARALVADSEALLDELESNLPTPLLDACAALRHVCRRDTQRARELLHNPRTRHGHEERGSRKRETARLLTSAPTTPAS